MSSAPMPSSVVPTPSEAVSCGARGRSRSARRQRHVRTSRPALGLSPIRSCARPAFGPIVDPSRRGGRDTAAVRANLVRIVADGDGRAEQVLSRMPRVAAAGFLASLDDRVGLDLGRYGLRQATVALRQRSVERLRNALLATALSAVIRSPDARDWMVGAAVHHVVAQQLGVEASALFNDVADRLPPGAMADLLREFGARRDVTLAAFGWLLIDTEDGPDFAPT